MQHVLFGLHERSSLLSVPLLPQRPPCYSGNFQQLNRVHQFLESCAYQIGHLGHIGVLVLSIIPIKVLPFLPFSDKNLTFPSFVLGPEIKPKGKFCFDDELFVLGTNFVTHIV